MRVLLDTSVLLAGMIEGHSHHAVALPWLQRVKGHELEGVVAAHSLAELYAILTALPLRVRIPATAAWQLIQENVLEDFEAVTLADTEYYTVLRNLSLCGGLGDVVSEALIARAAAKAGVDFLITLYPEDFRRVWPQGGTKIREP
jgi:predicted nucleic acid-binding protein